MTRGCGGWLGLDDLPDGATTGRRLVRRPLTPGAFKPSEQRSFRVRSPAGAATAVRWRRVDAKVEWHPGELYPRVGFIVTNLRRSARRVIAFYNGRGTAEQWIKEGKHAVKWTRL